MNPNFLVAGSMKCGTSALYAGVTNHPDVFGAAGKELHYFDRNYEKGTDWYQGHFEGAGAAHAVGEGTPYLGDEPAMTRMVGDLPEARYLFIIRQPVDRAYSHYWHNRRRGREERGFEECFVADLEAEVAEPWMNYWRLGQFATHLGRIAEDIDRGQMLTFLDEDLRGDRAGTLRRCWEFLEVDPDAGGFESPRQRPPHRKLIRTVKNLIRGRSDDTSYPPIDRTVRKRLTEVYADEIRRLESFLDRDLGHWRS